MVLDKLDAQGMDAVFFIQTHARDSNNSYNRGMLDPMGHNMVERMDNEGHVVGVHTGMDGQRAHAEENDHNEREAINELAGDLQRAKAFIDARTGSAPKYVRPPFGTHNSLVDTRYEAEHLNCIIWDIDSEDWTRSHPTGVSNHLASEVNRLLTEGDRRLVILFHDLVQRPNEKTPAHLNTYITRIRDTIVDRGFNPRMRLTRTEIEEILDDY
jgi:peptidoglycan/xylan/chitin deacetylase (PgdA/CDA1 family)